MDCERFDRVVLDLALRGARRAHRRVGAAPRRTLRALSGASLGATRHARGRGVAARRSARGARAADPRSRAQARERLPLRQRAGRAVSVLAGYAMRPQLAMAALLLLAIGSSLIFFRARPGDRESVSGDRTRRAGERDRLGGRSCRSRQPNPSPRHRKPRQPAASAVARAEAESRPKARRHRLGRAGRRLRVRGRARRVPGRSLQGSAPQFERSRARRRHRPPKRHSTLRSRRRWRGLRGGRRALRPGTDALPGHALRLRRDLAGGDCYEMLGDTERAKRSYQALLDEPNYGERAKAALAQLERAEQQPRRGRCAKGPSRAAPAAAPAPAKPPRPPEGRARDRPAEASAADTPRTPKQNATWARAASARARARDDRRAPVTVRSARADHARVGAGFAEIDVGGRHDLELAVGRIERRAADLHRSEVREERRNQVVLGEVPPHVVLDQARVDLRRELVRGAPGACSSACLGSRGGRRVGRC